MVSNHNVDKNIDKQIGFQFEISKNKITTNYYEFIYGEIFLQYSIVWDRFLFQRIKYLNNSTLLLSSNYTI